jgi:transcriptional regulator GlxA family with amidase domain
MKPSATGRILLWRGGSIWIGLAGEPADSHAHHAVQIALPFAGGRVRFQVPGKDWQDFDAALVAAHQTHAFEARDQFMATLFVEPESREGRELQRRARDAGVVALDTRGLKAESEALASAYQSRASDEELMTLARATITKMAGSQPAPRIPGDPRVTRAIERIRARLGETVSLSAIAADVHLSPDRFRHLFLDETGVGLRPYVLWLRLETSLAAYVAGSSLTAAAHAGGFADSAHLSRTFKKMFGISPASVQPE